MEKEDILKYLPHRIEEIPRLDEEVTPEGKKVLESLSEALVLISDRINLRILDAKRINLRLKDSASEISDSDVGGSCSFEMDLESKFNHYKLKCRDLIKELKKLLDENSHLLVVKALEERLKLTKGLNIAAKPFDPTLAPANQPGGNRINLPRSVSPVDNETQPVFVPGNQVMFKTKLCTFWQRTRACSDGEQCNFAHGYNELRPYILHPHYRTEVCRTVLAGLHCPYGYRCQFRHQ